MTSFDDYLAGVPEPQKSELERIRRLVRSAVPEAEEATSYGLPAFKCNQSPLLGLKASKNHLSVFPFSPEAVDAAREALAGSTSRRGLSASPLNSRFPTRRSSSSCVTA
jgi:uncharacterized protein YdhG (YjbR/CyaY superfamily)